MTTLDLKAEISKAINENWAEFAKEHPRMAQFVQREILVEEAMADLAADPQYQQAMEQAAVSNATLTQAIELVRRFVKNWLINVI